MKINLGHKHKIILGCIVLFLVIDAAVLFFKLASNRYSKSVLSYEGNFAAPEKLLLGTCKKEPEHKLFPGAEKIIFKELRIFQLAEEKKSGIQTELWNSTWVKCR